jgi:large subunit ribosomal protein L4
MISVPVHNQSGKEVGSYEFDPADLAPGINKQLLHDVVVMYESNKRVGTVRTKSRGMVSGSTAKLFRQKGTGRARAGSSRSPIRKGGGHTFGKVPLDWSYRLPKKAVKLATRMALLSKFQDNEAIVLDDLTVSEPKTKTMSEVLKALGVSGTGCLLAIEGHSNNVWLSSRNIENLQVLPASDLNSYQLLHQKKLIITKSALDSIRNKSNDSEG